MIELIFILITIIIVAAFTVLSFYTSVNRWASKFETWMIKKFNIKE